MYNSLLADKAVQRLVAIAKGEVDETLAEEPAPDLADEGEPDPGLDETLEESDTSEPVVAENEAPPAGRHDPMPAPEADEDEGEAPEGTEMSSAREGESIASGTKTEAQAGLDASATTLESDQDTA
jgi:hypothetical protein